MTDAQIELQNALTTTFFANLAFLSEYDNELYHRVDELSRMIGNGTYKEKYTLEFNMQDGDFDIYDKVNNKYLYNKKPKSFNDDLVRKVEFDEKNSIIGIPQYFTIKRESKVDRDRRFDFNTLDEFVTLTHMDSYAYTTTLNDFIDKKKKRIKKIDKFIFLGVLLGRHIPRIAQKIDAKMYLVLERNLEIFRLSLFTVDYTILAKKGVIFSIMNDYIEDEKYIGKFLDISRFDNYMIKFSTSSINITKYIDNILSTMSSLNPTLYDYNRNLYVYINRTTKYLQKYRFLQFNEIKKNCKLFNNTPILYIAAGPSLDENMEWIKQNQDKFFIVTIGSAYKKLLKNNIHIEMITTLDEQEFIATNQFDDEGVKQINKNTIILASSITNKKVLEKFNQENLFLYETFFSFYKGGVAFNGFSIGEITLDILMHLNAKQIYTIGLDLAINQETGETHSKGASSGVAILNLEKEQTRDTFSERQSLIKVKGNQKDEVFTTALFYSSIKSAEAKIKNKNNDIEIFNLSNNGAYLEGTMPKKIEEIDIKSFKKIKNIDLKEYFQQNSKDSLDDESKKLFVNEIEFIDTKIKKLLEEIKNREFKNYEEFSCDITAIISIISKNKYFMLHQNIFGYFSLYMPYLNYHFNDKKSKNEDKIVKKTRDILISQLEILFQDYKDCLKRVV